MNIILKMNRLPVKFYVKILYRWIFFLKAVSIFIYIFIELFSLGGCRIISIQLAREFKDVDISVVPGKRICPSCKMIKLSSFKSAGPSGTNKHTEDDTTDIDADVEHIPNNFLKEQMNSSFTSMDITPFKIHVVASHSRVTHGKKKLLQVQQTRIESTLNINPQHLKEKHSN